MPFGFGVAGKPEDGRPWSSSDGLPDQLQRGDKSGLFWECSALERSASRTGEQRSGRLAKRPKAGRSWSLLAGGACTHLADMRSIAAIALASAIPGGSRRFCRRSERDQRERRTCEPFTPREARSAEVLPDWHLRRPGRRPGRRLVALKGERCKRSPSRGAKRLGLGFGDSRSLESGLDRFAQAE